MGAVVDHEAFAQGDLVSAYRIEQLLGIGGMGEVYRACHCVQGRVAALKVLRRDQLNRERAVERMMREASILAALGHAGIPRFYECGMLEDGRSWIAMELVANAQSLLDRLRRGPLAAELVIELLSAIANVLAAAHARGIIHRDLKPDNVLLTPSDPSIPLRLIDWGIAYEQRGARFTDHDEAIGTPTYMAPEQARGGSTDARCDVYGLGVLAYHALTGAPPFVGGSGVEILVQHLNRSPPALAPRCPTAPIWLVELVGRMLEKDCEARPSADDLITELAAGGRPRRATTQQVRIAL
jgi:serine/threonine-protein kinase